MPACHTKPFVLPGVAVDTRDGEDSQSQCSAKFTSAESCDYCGSEQLEWRKCKLICAACRQINKSCADL
jgi:hypothetical protein